MYGIDHLAEMGSVKTCQIKLWLTAFQTLHRWAYTLIDPIDLIDIPTDNQLFIEVINFQLHFVYVANLTVRVGDGNPFIEAVEHWQ